MSPRAGGGLRQQIKTARGPRLRGDAVSYSVLMMPEKSMPPFPASTQAS